MFSIKTGMKRERVVDCLVFFSLKRNRESFVFFYALYNPAFCIDKEAD